MTTDEKIKSIKEDLDSDSYPSTILRRLRFELGEITYPEPTLSSSELVYDPVLTQITDSNDKLIINVKQNCHFLHFTLAEIHRLQFEIGEMIEKNRRSEMETYVLQVLNKAMT